LVFFVFFFRASEKAISSSWWLVFWPLCAVCSVLVGDLQTDLDAQRGERKQVKQGK
jgi:hypothetical protein